MQNLNINQLKIEVHDKYKKDEKIRTNLKAVKDDDVVIKAYLDGKLSKIDGHLSLFKKDYNDLYYNTTNNL